MKKKNNKQKGAVILYVLVFATIAVILITALTVGGSIAIKAARNTLVREQALQIAEAGIEYYRWHLAHDKTDFQDGTGEEGPYVHDYYDIDGNKIGHFSLDITPPLVGSTLVTIQSSGATLDKPNATRTLEVQMAMPSLAKYAVAANDTMRFGEGTEIYGPVHSNGGIRFDGLAHNIISSSKESYTDPDGDACTSTAWGVHTCLSPSDLEPPIIPDERTDVFEAGREYPQPQIDFAGFTSDLASIKVDAQDAGVYLADSGSVGYRIEFKTDDTFDLYIVTSTVTPPSYCSSDQDNWGTWSVNSESFEDNYDIPSNGLIFVEDNVWVEGEIDGARVLIVSAKFPETPATYTNIIINNDLEYTNNDGTDVIGLIAQGDVSTGMVSEDDLVIDAALVAQNGRVGRYYYKGPYWFWFWQVSACSPYHERDTLTLTGMIATNNRYGFAYTDGTGYDTRNINYDGNLLYSPPPSFPLTSDQYETLLWREVE